MYLNTAADAHIRYRESTAALFETTNPMDLYVDIFIPSYLDTLEGLQLLPRIGGDYGLFGFLLCNQLANTLRP
jgi:hypothetical protein